ncbi:hypothetical protein HDU85_004321 [Gaertneriomyces sp. JEL0708]|nr:hypothetical protein HDU85_004321 [Gaertneriomyces sp. JEL0708]
MQDDPAFWKTTIVQECNFNLHLGTIQCVLIDGTEYTWPLDKRLALSLSGQLKCHVTASKTLPTASGDSHNDEDDTIHDSAVDLAYHDIGDDHGDDMCTSLESRSTRLDVHVLDGFRRHVLQDRLGKVLPQSYAEWNARSKLAFCERRIASMNDDLRQSSAQLGYLSTIMERLRSLATYAISTGAPDRHIQSGRGASLATDSGKGSTPTLSKSNFLASAVLISHGHVSDLDNRAVEILEQWFGPTTNIPLCNGDVLSSIHADCLQTVLSGISHDLLRIDCKLNRGILNWLDDSEDGDNDLDFEEMFHSRELLERYRLALSQTQTVVQTAFRKVCAPNAQKLLPTYVDDVDGCSSVINVLESLNILLRGSDALYPLLSELALERAKSFWNQFMRLYHNCSFTALSMKSKQRALMHRKLGCDRERDVLQRQLQELEGTRQKKLERERQLIEEKRARFLAANKRAQTFTLTAVDKTAVDAKVQKGKRKCDGVPNPIEPSPKRQNSPKPATVELAKHPPARPLVTPLSSPLSDPANSVESACVRRRPKPATRALTDLEDADGHFFADSSIVSTNRLDEIPPYPPNQHRSAQPSVLCRTSIQTPEADRSTSAETADSVKEDLSPGSPPTQRALMNDFFVNKKPKTATAFLQDLVAAAFKDKAASRSDQSIVAPV